MSKITSKTTNNIIKIYIDNILHIRFPYQNDIKIHSWIDASTRFYCIEIWCCNHTEKYEYENRDLWENMLKVLDTLI